MLWRFGGGGVADRALEPVDAFRGSQKAWDLPLARTQLANLLDQAAQFSRARLLAA